MKRMQRMRTTDNWHERIALASDKWPGTEFDHVFGAIQQAAALVAGKCHPGMVKEIYAFLGQQLTQVVQARGPQGLHDMGDALKEWRSHKANPDQIRKALILEAGSQKKTSVKNVLAHLRREGITTDENTPRLIRRFAAELQIQLAGGTKSP